MRWTSVWALGVSLVACVGAAVAQDAGPPKEESPALVVRAKLSRSWRAEDGTPLVLAVRPGSTPPIAGSRVRMDGTDLRAEFDGPGGARPGFVQLGFPDAALPVVVLAPLDRLTGDVDVGDVALGDAAPVLAAGRVLSAEGQPAAGARVTLNAAHVIHRSFRWSVGTAACGDDGAFSFRGFVRGDGLDLTLEVEGAWAADAPVAVAPGTRDTRVVVGRRHGVAGVLDLPPGLLPEDVELVVTGPIERANVMVDGGSGWWRRGSTMWIRCERRSFGLRGLAPGSYDFAVRFRGAGKDLVRRPGIRVSADDVWVPPLVVTGRVRHVPVRVCAEKGAHLAGARLWAREADDSGGFREVPLDEGRGTVTTLGDEVSLAACGTDTGYVFATATTAGATLVPPVPAPTTVTITPRTPSPPSVAERLSRSGAHVTLRWIAPAEGRPPAAVYDLRHADPREEVRYTTPLPPTGRVEFRVAVPGWYRAGLRVAQADSTTESCFEAVRVDGRGDVAATIDLGAAPTAEDLRPDGRDSRGTGLRGTLELPPGLDLGDLSIVVAGPPGGVRRADTGGAGLSITAGTLQFDARPQFSVTRLVPGTYEVRLKFRGSSRWLARVADVEVTQGTVTALEPLRVTEPVRRASVRLEVPEGTPRDSLQVWARNAGDRGDWREVRVPPEGPVPVAYVGESVSVAARAAGTSSGFATASGPECELKLTAAAPATVTIRLPPGTSQRVRESGALVKLEWRAPPETPEARISVDEDDKDPRRRTAVVEVPFPDQGDLRTTVDEPGWYRVRIGVRRGGGATWRPANVTLLVKPGADVAADLDVDAAWLDHWIDDR